MKYRLNSINMHPFFTKIRLITLAVSSASLLLFSILLSFVIVPVIIDSQIDKNIRLVRGTDQWHRFKHLPFNISFNVTLFAVDNVEDVVNKGAKPILREQGPYVFDEILDRKQIIYNDNNSITLGRQQQFYFNQTRSGPDVHYNDTITMINPAYVAFMQVLHDIGLDIFEGAVESCLRKMFNNTPHVLKDYPVKNILFEGIRICDYKYWFEGCPLVCPFLSVSKVIEEVNKDGEHYVKFSLFNYRQIEFDGVYEVNTGIPNIANVGNVDRWNYETYTSNWNQSLLNNSCNEVKGTDGTIYPPHLTEDYEALIYSTDICRSVKLYNNGTSTYHDIEGLVYEPKPTIFYASTPDPADDCYCNLVKGTKDEKGNPSCFLDGMIDIYPCLNLPVTVSLPHFMNANEKYLQNLTGMNPDPEKHRLRLLLDKYTGIPLQVNKRVQMNLILRPVQAFKSSKNFARTVLPLCWIDEGLALPDSGLEMLNSLLYNTLSIVNILKWTFIGVSLALTIFSVGLLSLHHFSA